jgi:hypothetical protein
MQSMIYPGLHLYIGPCINIPYLGRRVRCEENSSIVFIADLSPGFDVHGISHAWRREM